MDKTKIENGETVIEGKIVSKDIKQLGKGEGIIIRVATANTNYDGSQEVIESEWWGLDKENVRTAKKGDTVQMLLKVQSNKGKTDPSRLFLKLRGKTCEVKEAATAPSRPGDDIPVEPVDSAMPF